MLQRPCLRSWNVLSSFITEAPFAVLFHGCHFGAGGSLPEKRRIWREARLAWRIEDDAELGCGIEAKFDSPV